MNMDVTSSRSDEKLDLVLKKERIDFGKQLNLLWFSVPVLLLCTQEQIP